MYKNTRQVEFCNLMQRMEQAGLRQADVARLLRKSHGAISQYISGKTNPSEAALELMRRVVEEKTDTAKTQTDFTVAELRDKLASLKENDPAGFLAASTTIDLLHSRIPAPVARPPDPTKVSSIVDAAATKLLKLAAASVRKDDPK